MTSFRMGYAFGGGIVGASALSADVAGVAIGVAVILATGVIRSVRGAPTPQFTDLERVELASDEAYDHADALPGGRTVVEDKRTAQCYEATYGGDRRVA